MHKFWQFYIEFLAVLVSVYLFTARAVSQPTKFVRPLYDLGQSVFSSYFGLPSSATNVSVGFSFAPSICASSFCNVLFACFVLVLIASLHFTALLHRYAA